MAMLEGVSELTLERLNEITYVWVEQEYHQRRHAELGLAPMRRYLDHPNVGRPCPQIQVLHSAFCCIVKRRQRRSDGTVSLAGKRFEIPDRYRHMDRPHIRYARWDLRRVELIDPHTLVTLCPLYPLDKSANADGQRRSRNPSLPQQTVVNPKDSLPPLLRKLLADYAATGRPPAYLSKPDPESSS